MGRWSRAVAAEFVTWLDLDPGATWLDVGCGTGALMGAVIDTQRAGSVTGIDPSEHFLGVARRRLGATVDLRVGDAADIPFPDGSFDVAVSGLALNFVPDPATAVREMRRVTSGGNVAVYLWDYVDGMELIRYFWDGAVNLDPGSASLDEAVRFPLCAPEPMMHLFDEAGLEHVDTRPIDVPMVFRDFDDFWNPFLLAQGPAPEYVASLGPDDRLLLRDAIRDALPIAGDGTIRLTARAWAVSGVAP
jgi:SAM-dependent methyltransferase